jgi:rare lipoprotein A
MFSHRILRAFYRQPVENYFSNVIQVPTVLMIPPASSFKRKRNSTTPPSQRGRVKMTIALALAFLTGMISDEAKSHDATAAVAGIQSNSDSGAVVLPLVTASLPADAEVEAESGDEAASQIGERKTCDATTVAVLSRLELPVAGIEPRPFTIAPQVHSEIFEPVRAASTDTGNEGADFVSFARRRVLSKFAPAYRSVLKLAAFIELPRIQSEAALNNAMIMGTVSTYNPYRDGIMEGGTQTASGELYDPAAWTAAIQTDLRNQFGGVRYGGLYQPAFALVESDKKQVIVKINDVGRLRPGRVLDLNERSMRYFDPFLTRGLIDGVTITLLPGEDWIPGPVGGVHLISVASTAD